MPSPEFFLLAALLALAAGVQGFLGFGFGMLAMTSLTWSHDLLHAAGVVNLCGLVLTATLAWSLRDHVLWRQVGRIVPAALAGVVVGVTLLSQVDPTWLVRTLGASIIAISLYNLIAPALGEARDSVAVDAGVGLLAGLLSGAFNTGGPPLIAHLYRRHEPPESLRATVQALFLGVGLARLPVAATAGLMTPPVWRDALLAAPAVGIATLVGAALARRVPPERFRRQAWALLGAMGLMLLVRA